MNTKDLQSTGLALVIIGLIFSPVFGFIGATPLASIGSALFFVQETSLDSQNEVEEYRAEVARLEAEVASLLYLSQENEQLKRALNVSDEELSIVQAQILADDPILLQRSIVVNKGEADGLKQGQAVIYLGGLIGVVQKPTESTATIRLLQDGESSVPAQITREGEEPIKGIVRSNFGIELTLDLIPNTVPIEVGSPVFTSGIDDMPAGLFVGNVAETEEGELYQRVLIERTIDTNSMTQVFVITS